MKKVKIFTLLVTAAFLFGCAEIAPRIVSKDVYEKSKEQVVAEKEARTERLNADKRGQVLAQKRAEMRSKVAEAELEKAFWAATGDHPSKGQATGAQSAKAPKVMSAEGIIGGFPVIFINDSERNKELIVKKKGSDFADFGWHFTLPKRGGIEIYKFEAGDYDVWWTVEYDNRLYPEPKKPERLTVTTTPKFFYKKTGESYHGAFRLWGY